MQYGKLASLALAISLTPLNGCATGASDAACLNVRPYTAAEQAAAADELDRLGPQSMTGKFMADYGRLRDEARAMCR
ncbi:hypothetical protein [Parvibaculum sp.]|uniref:hypothetical protein n=1 Tax=Parvibaculum sp. TaxID=2024848 RepID=UPI0025DB1944|nr:hypothetical protein [Parvibaculum sp.]